MKKRITMVGIISFATALMIALGYWIVTTVPYLSQPLDDAAAHYINAVNALEIARNMELQINISTQTKIGDQTYTEASSQTATYQGFNTDSMRASVDEVLTVGPNETNVTEIYCDNMVYITMLSSNFAGNCSAEEFLSRQVPAAALDHTLYKNITGEIKHNTAIITFTQATAAEAWALPDGCEFMQAEGMAWLNEEDNLLKSRYTITYRNSDATVTAQYNIAVNTDSAAQIAPPTNHETYTLLEAPHAPRLLEKATGYLSQEGSITAKYDEQIHCEAFGDKRIRNILINMHADDARSARLDTSITLTNSSREDDIVYLTQSEVFLNGEHIVSSNGSEPESDATVTEDLFHNYCHELLLGTIMQLQYISDATQTELTDVYHIEFTANDDFARYVSAYACQSLYQDSGVLDSIAESYTTNDIRCYLDISKTTGLPTAAGIYFSGSHTIHNLQYQLIYQADQVYTLPGLTAKDAITAPLT